MGGNPIAHALTRPLGVHPARQRAIARQTCHLHLVEAVKAELREQRPGLVLGQGVMPARRLCQRGRPQPSAAVRQSRGVQAYWARQVLR